MAGRHCYISLHMKQWLEALRKTCLAGSHGFIHISSAESSSLSVSASAVQNQSCDGMAMDSVSDLAGSLILKRMFLSSAFQTVVAAMIVSHRASSNAAFECCLRGPNQKTCPYLPMPTFVMPCMSATWDLTPSCCTVLVVLAQYFGTWGDPLLAIQAVR